MHRTEAEAITVCADCGTELDVERDRGYAAAASLAICFECAVKRGGSYDGIFERWVDAPRLDGLEDHDA
ncbi:MAG: hypothetical protein RIF41_25345 [Polyangiaceae bacterium]